MELMELTEVATVMGISLATTKRNLARAKRRLWVLAERDPILAPYLVDGGEHAREGES
jgi:DNA-directed RNA polymerase specialized sigma24 family protein